MEKYYLYIVLTRTSTIISRLIRFFKKDDYTHAAISLDKKLKVMYSFARKAPYNPLIGGFMQERLDKGIYKLHRELPGKILEVEVSEEQYQKAKSLLEHFVDYRHLYGYNYMGLLHSLNRTAVCYDNRFLCSEFVYYILKESGIADLNKPRNLVRPQNLLALESRIVYEGNLKNLLPPERRTNTGLWGRLSALYEQI